MKFLKSIILSEINAAIKQTRLLDDHEIEERVHSIRRRCKRIRAYLELFEHSQVKRLREVRHLVRLAAKSLSPTRDAQVIARIWQPLRRQLLNHGADAKQIDVFGKAIDDRATQWRNSAGDAFRELQKSAKYLNQAKRKTIRIPSKLSRKAALQSLEQSYRYGREATLAIIEQKTPGGFHELRKATKKLYHQCQILSERDNLELKDTIDRARLLADQLGDGLDLYLLESHLSELADAGAELPSNATVISVSASQREAIFAECIPLACQVYFECPKQFRVRIAH